MPFTRSVIDPDDGRKDSIGRGAGMKPRRLEQTKPFHEPVNGPRFHPSSIIDVKIPYVDDAPTSIGPYKNLPNTDQIPISICTDEPNVIHQWAEPLTFRHDNYGHFISEDCEPTNPIAKLLVATERLDLQDLWGCRPKRDKSLSLRTADIRHIPLS